MYVIFLDIRFQYTHHHYRARTLPRGESCETFDDESPQPPIGNLTTHTKTAHPDKIKGESQTEANPEASTKPSNHGYTAASAKLMEEFLLEGKLNPKIEPTRAGFMKLFASWLLEEDLPFTTGEAPSLKRLFEYLEVKYQLPTDTAVRNTLAHIFATLHATVVEELSVSPKNTMIRYVDLNSCNWILLGCQVEDFVLA